MGLALVLALAAALRLWGLDQNGFSAPATARAFIAFLTRPVFKAKFAAAALDYKQP